MAENQGSEIVSFKEFGLNLDLFLMQYIQLMQNNNKKNSAFIYLCLYFAFTFQTD